ncbi:unnamed protein product [Linum trigynum]|uniref:Cytochrome P450 n=1 Tax=Linum trigynum TaxID=586398 RepID=A0AAV2EDJ3_9ROSI
MSPLLYLLLALPIIISLLFRPRNHKKTNATSSHYCLPPGPPCLPFIGNLLQIDGSNPHISLRQLSRVYGPLMSLRLGRVRVLVASSAKMAEEVLKTHDLALCTRPPRAGQQKLSYNGIDLAFSPFGVYWREMRKTCIVHLFNSNRVQSLAPIRAQEVRKVMEKVSKSSFESKPFNLSDAMVSLAGMIVCRMAFDKGSYEEVGEEGSRVQGLINETQAMFTSFFFSNHFPLLGFVDSLTGLNRRLDKTFEELDHFCQETVDEHLNPNRVKHEHEDVLDVLVRTMNDGSSRFQLTVDHVKAIVMNLFIAGTDTAAAALVWTMTYLMKNPKAMKKAQEEVRQVVGRDKGFVDEQDINQLPYLKAVVKETMRLQPPAPLLIRESNEDCILGGYTIPPKTVVHVNVYAIGRDQEIWGDDSEEFRPERFMEKPGDDSKKGLDFDMVPFGGGRRMCPGMHMGLAIVHLTLANLLYGFDWEMPSGMERQDLDMEVILGLTMHKKNALCLMARKYL